MVANVPTSVPNVCDVSIFGGDPSRPDQGPDLLLEVPHGATRAAHFDRLRRELVGEFPENLRDFFFVNTDVGAPDVARRLAEMVVALEPARRVLVIRCLIPRTFIDCNRLIDPEQLTSTSEAGAVTPGIVSYVREPEDLALLLERYEVYRGVVAASFDLVCGGGGRALMLHSYAPRSIEVPVDEAIVERLREAYQPGVLERWALRPQVDLITQAEDGQRPADEALAGSVREAFVARGIPVEENSVYPLHSSTTAHELAVRHPGRTLCLEMRRDLLVETFTPFVELEADPAKVERMAGALAEGVLAS